MSIFDVLLGRKNNSKYILQRMQTAKNLDEQVKLINSLLDGPKFNITFRTAEDATRFIDQHIPYNGRNGTLTFVRPLSDCFALFTGGKISNNEALAILKAMQNKGTNHTGGNFYDWTPPGF